MVRLQVRLTEDQVTALRQLAEQRQVSVSALVREAVDLLTTRSNAFSDDQTRRALAFIGAFADSAVDVSENHDQYLAAIWAPEA